MMWSVITLCAALLYFVAAEQLEIIDKPVSFPEAEKACVAKGGHLASIHDRNHNDRLKDICRGSGSPHNCWIGLKNDGQDWKWTDGTSLDYTMWHAGNPTTVTGSLCAAIVRQYSDVGEWISESCDAPDTKAVALCSIGGSQNPNTGNQNTPNPNTGHTNQPVTAQPVTSKPVTMAVPDLGKAPARKGTRLTVKGTDFEQNGKKVFLSGVNQAWIAYGYDFGDNNYEYRHLEFEKYLKLVADNGGNSIRVWVHIEGAVTPHFDASGMVVSLDQKGTFISDIKKYLRKALEYNILIFFCLWNGALAQNDHFKLDGLIKDEAKLQSYIDNALIPWVKAVKDEPSMGGWDIINEMEGEIKPNLANAEPCFDTKFLLNSGAGWAGQKYTAEEFLKFINWQVDAIRQVDPQALVTAGSWEARDNVDKWGGFNLYKDECLVKAGGKKMGTLTFYSSHTYSWQGKYSEFSPFKHVFADYGLKKPLVVAEFNQVSGAGMDIVDQFKHLYTSGYAGGWTWHAKADGANSDSTANQMRGLLSLKGKVDQTEGGQIPLTL
ncbi:mannan endo-1,4-beta-mannosidase-like [Haliotis rubra]|uniref:mannan endo-1,4-beta-mannosidase-like n=1 Tax=Haliotis rubra TaxID=36100 RepID=UPI001EE5593F|nr:mannan endo-1,4-beta-mannosidase-like [Haliotis rubra]